MHSARLAMAKLVVLFKGVHVINDEVKCGVGIDSSVMAHGRFEMGFFRVI